MVFPWTWGSLLVFWGVHSCPGDTVSRILMQQGRALLSQPLHQPPRGRSVKLEQSWEKFNPWRLKITQAKTLVKRLLSITSIPSTPQSHREKRPICLEFALKRKTTLLGQHLPAPAPHPLISATLAHGASRQRFFSTPECRREPDLQLSFSYKGNFNWD